MAKGTDLLDGIDLDALPDGRHSDGANNLQLVVKRNGTTRSWIFAFMSPTLARRREQGLGSYPKIGLDEARQDAYEALSLVRKRIDPIEAAAALKAQGAAQEAAAKAAAAVEHLTLRRAARKHYERIEKTFRSKRHAGQWIAAIENHLPKSLLDKPLAKITAADLLDTLAPLYIDVPETARRIRQRLEVIFAEAIVRLQCNDNPAAAIRASLKRKRTDKTNFRAMEYADVPAFVAKLRGLPDPAARALEFTILTAARTNEVLSMTWGEVKGDVWTIPASKMKVNKAHVVHLSPSAQAILAEVRGARFGTDLVFTRNGARLGQMSMWEPMKALGVAETATVHGFRSSFSDWAYETQKRIRGEAIEFCLAHREPDPAKASYFRVALLDDRAALLDAWAAFVAPLSAKAPVVKIGARR